MSVTHRRQSDYLGEEYISFIQTFYSSYLKLKLELVTNGCIIGAVVWSRSPELLTCTYYFFCYQIWKIPWWIRKHTLFKFLENCVDILCVCPNAFGHVLYYILVSGALFFPGVFFRYINIGPNTTLRRPQYSIKIRRVVLFCINSILSFLLKGRVTFRSVKKGDDILLILLMDAIIITFAHWLL